MSVVRRPKTPVEGNPTGGISQTPKELDIEDEEGWVTVQNKGIKLNPGDVAIFRIVGEPEETRIGGKVVLVEMIKYQGIDGTVVQNQTVNLFMQTLLFKKISAVLAQYPKQDVIFKVKNLGKVQGKRYYDFDVKYKIIKGDENEQ